MKDISPNQLNQGLIGVAKNQKLAAIVEVRIFSIEIVVY